MWRTPSHLLSVSEGLLVTNPLHFLLLRHLLFTAVELNNDWCLQAEVGCFFKCRWHRVKRSGPLHAVRAEETGLSMLMMLTSSCWLWPLKLVQEMRSEPLIVRFDSRRHLLFFPAALPFPLLFFFATFTFHFVFRLCLWRFLWTDKGIWMKQAGVDCWPDGQSDWWSSDKRVWFRKTKLLLIAALFLCNVKYDTCVQGHFHDRQTDWWGLACVALHYCAVNK